MGLLDQWAERHILDAQDKGEFDNLPGQGQPLTLEDDSAVPAELRAGYRLTEKCRLPATGAGRSQRGANRCSLTARD
jgi:Domain of unknown function (DUF1992).